MDTTGGTGPQTPEGHLLKSPARPVALFLIGPSGSGKTTVGRLLQEILTEPWLFFEVDRCQPRVPPKASIVTVANDAAMRRANLAAARGYVDVGFRIIIEMTLSDERAHRERALIFSDVVSGVVALACTRSTVEERTIARGDRDVTWALRHFDRAVWESNAIDLTVQTDDRSPSQVASEIASWIEGRPGVAIS